MAGCHINVVFVQAKSSPSLFIQGFFRTSLFPSHCRHFRILGHFFPECRGETKLKTTPWCPPLASPGIEHLPPVHSPMTLFSLPRANVIGMPNRRAYLHIPSTVMAINTLANIASCLLMGNSALSTSLTVMLTF